MKETYLWNDKASPRLREGLIVVTLALVAAGVAVLVAG